MKMDHWLPAAGGEGARGPRSFVCTPCAKGSAALGRNISEWEKTTVNSTQRLLAQSTQLGVRGRKGLLPFLFPFDFSS